MGKLVYAFSIQQNDCLNYEIKSTLNYIPCHQHALTSKSITTHHYIYQYLSITHIIDI